MTEDKIKRGWQPVDDVNWDAFERVIAQCKNKQQILTHLRILFEQKGYANMIRAAEIAYDRLVDVLPGNKSSIGVHTYVDGKEVYCNFRFEPAGGKQEKDSFEY